MRRKTSDPVVHMPHRGRRTRERPPARPTHRSPHTPGLFCYARTPVVNSDSLVPLLLAYGEELPADAGADPLSGAAAVEHVVLRTMRQVLAGMSAPAPPAATVTAVLTAARIASEESDLAPLRAALAGLDHGSAEGALLRTTLQAIERAGRQAPPAAVVDNLVAAARDAARSSDLASLRSVLLGTEDSDEPVEPALLRTTVTALETQPRLSPPADVVARIVTAAGAAARASELAPVRSVVGDSAESETGAEEALLRTTWQAVQLIPRAAPPIAALQAVLSAAHSAIPAPLREAGALRRAADRPSHRETRSFRRFAYLTAALAFAGLVSVGLWASVDGRRDAASTLASLDEQPAVMPVVPDAPAEESDAIVGNVPPPASPVPGTGVASNGPIAGVLDDSRGARNATFERPSPPPPPPPASPPPAPQEIARPTREERAATRLATPSPAGVGLAAVADRAESPGAGLAGAPGVAPAWEAGTDVRLLSLRLKAMQESSSGLAWEAPPAPLGALDADGTPAAGFSPVGVTSTPARFQVRVGPPGSD